MVRLKTKDIESAENQPEQGLRLRNTHGHKEALILVAAASKQFPPTCSITSCCGAKYWYSPTMVGGL
ncbi:hypothetical protein TWF694_001128 [Orbilia ellipsospora]|uniref:Uncharacterized protein n=1 Tax=Orbilia ellipsospora TaxID=2528407 RepID=A0AAV9XQW7_9PEZI